MFKSIYVVIFGLYSLFLTTSVYCQSTENDPLVVHLTTQQSLKPLYFAPLIADQSGFSDEYLGELDQILQFDFAQNGRTQLIYNDRWADKGNFADFETASVWKARAVSYVVKIQIKNQQIAAKALSSETNCIKSMDPLLLTGNLNQDRIQLHRLADTIHRALFGSEGIASTHVLYTYKYPVFKNSKEVWLSEIWEMDYDGGNARKVTDDAVGYCVTPCHIPPQSGKKSAAFMYVSYKNGQPKIYISSLNGSSSGRLNFVRGNQLMPAISRQRDKIAFISDIGGNPDLFLQEFNVESGAIGKPRQIFTAHQSTQGTPSFSPDGKQIAFVSNKDGNPRIYLINTPAVGTVLKDVKIRLISRANRESSAPCWSPDGKKLAYCARQGQERQIWVYDFDTDKEWQLTSGSGDKENPSWAPDSLHLIYNTVGKDNSDLYLIDLNQQAPVKITAGKGEKRFPSWEPKS